MVKALMHTMLKLGNVTRIYNTVVACGELCFVGISKDFIQHTDYNEEIYTGIMSQQL
jgi:hypothetical protein